MNSLGIKTVVSSATPVRLTSALTDPAAVVRCNKIVVQPIKALGGTETDPTHNVGWVYLMRGNVAKGTTGASCVLALDVDQNAQSIEAPTSLGFNLADYYLDADNAGDGALISYA